MKNQNSNETNLNKIFLKLPICHRLPDRTFKIKGCYFPVCSRCTGLYVGAFSYFIFVYFFYVQYTYSLILIAFIMILPTFLDGLTQFMGLRESKNLLRLSTGLIGGIGLAVLVKAFKFFFLMNWGV